MYPLVIQPYLTNMSKAPARVQEGGRVQIPADIRRNMELDTGDYVVINIQPLDGGA